jgi:hypothetical protein
MANIVTIIKAADAGYYGTASPIIRLTVVNGDGVTAGVDIDASFFKDALTQCGAASLLGLKGKLLIVNDATNPPTAVRGLGPNQL